MQWFKENILPYLLKILVFTILISGGYYLFILLPKIRLTPAVLEVTKILSQHASVLAENRLAMITLSQLSPKSPTFNDEKRDIVGRLKTTREKALSNLDSLKEIPHTDSKLEDRYPALLDETRSLYSDQQKILERVYATTTYQDGVGILRSDEAITVLTRQSNLVLEYQFWINQLASLIE